MAYNIIRSPAVRQDFDVIFDYLLEAALALGEPTADAYDRAVRRIAIIRSDMNNLAIAPFQGTLDSDIAPGLRHVTKSRAVFYFTVNEETRTVRIVAVFFGGQDHKRHMLKRLWQQ